MSSFTVGLSEVMGKIWIPIAIGASELVAGNEKPLGALFEQDKPAIEIYPKVVHDEILEPAWETFFSSILVRLAKLITPSVPEQIVIIPSKLLGAAWHWNITSHQSINKEASGGQNNNKKNFSSEFFEAIVKKPTDFILNKLGMEYENGSNGTNGLSAEKKKPNFLKYGLSQAAIFLFSGLALKYSDYENLPGVNIESDESSFKSLLKTIGYAIVEQITYLTGHSIRYYKDFKHEFATDPNMNDKKLFDKTVAAKAVANVINEKWVPGHALSAFAAAVSTHLLSGKIPKTTAALLGEFPMKIFNRMMNCHRRRATKYEFEYDKVVKDGKKIDVPVGYKLKDNKKVDNYRFNKVEIFNRFIGFCYNIFEPFRKGCYRVIEWASGVPCRELEASFDISEDYLRENHRKILEEAQHQPKIAANGGQASPTTLNLQSLPCQ